MIDNGFGEHVHFGIRQPVVAVTPDLVLVIAKASNFTVDLQARANQIRTQYRLHCRACDAEMNLETRIVTKAEIEDQTTDASKFCHEHAHAVKVKAAADGNYRKFREE